MKILNFLFILVSVIKKYFWGREFKIFLYKYHRRQILNILKDNNFLFISKEEQFLNIFER